MKDSKKNKGKRPLQVLYLPVDDGGCGWHRIRQWHEEFYNRDDVVSVIMTGKEPPEEQHQIIMDADVIVTRMPGLEYVKLIKTEFAPNKPIVFDHDDNTMEVLPTSEHYAEFGTQDAWAEKDGKIIPVWVTGKTEGFNRYQNLWGQMGLLWILGTADMVTTTVPNLLDHFMKYTSRECMGATIPNCINYARYPQGEFIPKDKKKDEIRIGWQGGVSHLGDWGDVSEALSRVLSDYPEVTLHIMGSYYKGAFKEFKDRITYYPWYPFKAYSFVLKTMGLDGAIIPLEDAKFNEYKSDIKFTEFSALGVPCLVKDMLPYSRVIKRGENAYTYKTIEEFEKSLRMMIEDLKSGGKRSKKIAENASNWAKEHRDIKKVAGDVVKLYKSLVPEEIREDIM